MILTFDDGYLDNWELAMPLLVRYKMKATVFVVASLIGKTNEWEKNGFRQGVPMMGAEHLREWKQAGLEIGSHGVNHRRIANLPPEELQLEGKKRMVLKDFLNGFQSFEDIHIQNIRSDDS